MPTQLYFLLTLLGNPILASHYEKLGDEQVQPVNSTLYGMDYSPTRCVQGVHWTSEHCPSCLAGPAGCSA